MWPGRDKLWVRIATLAAGLALAVSAVAFAFWDLDRLAQAQGRSGPWDFFAHAQAASLVLLTILVTGQLLLTSLLFWVVTLSFDAQPRVGPVKMAELIAASSLLNYLPLRPGLLGRAAYLKLRHQLPLRQSLWILAIVLALSMAVTAVVLAAVLLAPRGWRFASAVALLMGLSLASGPVAQWSLRRSMVAGWTWMPLRVAEMLVSAGRFWAALRVLGQEASYEQVLVAAAAGFFVTLIGPTPNGLGLREWVVQLLLPAGALASVVDRAVEIGVFALAGLWSLPRLRILTPTQGD